VIRHSARLAFVCLLAAALPAGLTSLADDRFGSSRGLDRADWWPFETGPTYGEVAPSMRFHERVLRLPVGSFDTRGAGLALPPALKLSAETAAAPGAPWLVQMQGPITETKKDVLRNAGATIDRFYPSNTFVVRAADPSKLAGLPHVLWAGPFQPGYRLSPSIGHEPTLDPGVARNETVYIRLRLFDADERAGIIAALQGLGASLDAEATFASYEKPYHVYVTASPQAILAAARMNAVSWIEEVSTAGFALNAETKVVMQSGFINNGTPYWDAGVDGSTQILTDMDSGLDVDTILMSHTATDAGTPGPSHRKVVGYTAWGGGNLMSCAGTGGYSHGTNTAQCAVGNRTDFGQNDELEGIAYKARVLFQDVGPTDLFSCLLGSLSPPSNLSGAYDEARSLGSKVFNGSFAICSYGTYGSHASDADQYAWDHRDFLGFYSGGNGGSGNACPGTNKNMISSGGHYQDPFQNEFYGSTGPGPDGRMGPTVLGPACDHGGGNPAPFDYNTSTSVQSTDDDITGPPSSAVNQGSCGTSFSSPWLMGAAGLIHDYFEKGFYPSGAANVDDAFGASNALVKAVLINSGDFVSGCVGCTSPGLMGSMGMGRVNLSNTLPIDGDARTVPGTLIVDRGMADGLVTSATVDEVIDVNATAPFRATLVWVDQPGSLLTNDLRLTVIGPAGDATQTYHGNNFSSGAYSLSEAAGGTVDDHTNVMESVRIDPADMAVGKWTVRVTGTNVPMGDPNFGNTQPYALIVTGGFESGGFPPEVSPAGAAAQLVVNATDPTSVTWQWENLNDATVTYQLYRGTLAALGGGSYDHGQIDATNCSLSANTTTLTDKTDGVDAYYLVGARRSGRDGSLGGASDGSPRPAANPVCP
jgi:hypothetical protein